MSTTDAGRVGEAKILASLAESGWYPFVDISGKCPVDIIAWKDGQTLTFQVKATSTTTASGKWAVQIGSVRPNRSGNVIKKFDPTAQDYLAIYIAPLDTVMFLKADAITAGRSIAVSAIANQIA